MNPLKFLSTVYLGDRALKSFLVDGWNARVCLQVDCISRVRGETWNFYNVEDVTDGLLVFTHTTSFRIDPPGAIPDDYIIGWDAAPAAEDASRWCVQFQVGCCSGHQAAVEIVCQQVHIEDPARPGVKITD